jgi:serine/threonine kinase 16
MITLQQYISQWIHWIVVWCQSFYDRWFGTVLLLDSGIQVRIGHQLAEGGFSLVFRAVNASNHTIVYALKRIHCHDPETRQLCRDEAKVHRVLLQDDINNNNANYVMPLLGMTFDNQYCYMLFPYLPHSLRMEVNRRIFPNSNNTTQTISPSTAIPPWSELVVLELFSHILHGVAAMHASNYSHRDIKLENLLCKGSNPTHLVHPILMDFGSTGPLRRSFQTRRDVLEIADDASSHTTMPYRPPELFYGELRVGGNGNGNDGNDDDLDYTKVDVWSLGCTLFAILYGASPFECEFNSRNNGRIRIVDCSPLRVLAKVPSPPPDSPPSKWYSPEIRQLIEWMLQKDRHERPTLAQVQARVGDLRIPKPLPPHHDVEDPIMDILFSQPS